MTNKSRIKIILIFLFLATLSIALYLRQPKSEWDPGWGQGQIKLSEKIYYRKRLWEIVHNWMEMPTQVLVNGHWQDPEPTFLVIDLDKQAIWTQAKGQIQEENYAEFPENMSWSLYFLTPSDQKELTGRTIFRKSRNLIFQETPEQFFLAGTGRGLGHIGFTVGGITNASLCGESSIAYELKNWGYFPSGRKWNPDYSFLITDSEYQKYHDSLVEQKINQPDKNKADSTVLKQNKIRWYQVEKFLYMEIDKQIHNSGYTLRNILVEPGPDFSAGYAEVSCDYNPILRRYLRIGNVRAIKANFNIVHIGDGIWFVKAMPNPNIISAGQYKPDNKFTLEFLFVKDKKIIGSQRRKLIKQGRNIMRQKQISQSNYKASLPNGTTIEVLGVCVNPSAGKQWWSPDGNPFDYVPVVNIETPVNIPDSENRSFFDIAWQIKSPKEGITKTTSSSFDNNNLSSYKQSKDKYGHHLGNINGGIFGFSKSDSKTTLTLKVETADNKDYEITFKNISLVPEQNQGFEIEVNEEKE